MDLDSLGGDINSKNNSSEEVSDADVHQVLIEIIVELRKMNLQLEAMTGEKFKDGDYDAPN